MRVVYTTLFQLDPETRFSYYQRELSGMYMNDHFSNGLDFPGTNDESHTVRQVDPAENEKLRVRTVKKHSIATGACIAKAKKRDEHQIEEPDAPSPRDSLCRSPFSSSRR